jgi:hypothetical protein
MSDEMKIECRCPRCEWPIKINIPVEIYGEGIKISAKAVKLSIIDDSQIVE